MAARLGRHRLSLFTGREAWLVRAAMRERSASERRARTRPNREASMAETMTPPKLVHVRAYVRTRFGRPEHVCEHRRGWPRQLSFGF